MRTGVDQRIAAACVLVSLAVAGPLLPAAQAQTSSPSDVRADEDSPLPNVVALMGLRRSDITAMFPGRDLMFRPWHGWDRILLLFSRDGLVAVSLYRTSAITEQQADDALRRLGVTVEPDKYFAGAAERGYSDMTGPIRTVIYGVDGAKVTRISISSRLADND